MQEQTWKHIFNYSVNMLFDMCSPLIDHHIEYFFQLVIKTLEAKTRKIILILPDYFSICC